MRKLWNSMVLLSHVARRRSTIPLTSLRSKSNVYDAPFNPLTIPNKFIATPFRNISSHHQIEEKSQLEKAFESAETTEEMLKAFRDMERAFNEKDLALASLKIAIKLDREGKDPLKAHYFAKRALKAFDNDKPSVPVAKTLQLLGSINYRLKRFSDSLGYLNKANMVVGRLQNESFEFSDVMPVLHAVQLQLANVKIAMGRREEALENLRKCLEIQEKAFKEDSVELGKANRCLAEAYAAVFNFKEALSYCTKAMDIHIKRFGPNSVEVAHDRKTLGSIYIGLEEYEKALEQNFLVRRILKHQNLKFDLLRAEIDWAEMKISWGKYDEAVGTLARAVKQTSTNSVTRALVLVSIAKVLCIQEKFADCKTCLEMALGILDKKENISPVEVSEAYLEISMQYENMNDFETAISLLKRSLALLEKLPQPQEQHSKGCVSARIGWLLLRTGKVQQASP